MDKPVAVLNVHQAVAVRPLPAVAATQCGVFSRYQAELAGWTVAALRHALRTGRIRRLRNGAFQAADLNEVRPGIPKWERARWRHAADAIAAVLVTPGSLASHSTAAVLQSVPLLYLPERPCASVQPWVTGELPRIHLHRTSRTPPPTVWNTVECTPPEQTAVGLAREHGVGMGLVAADYLLHVKATTADCLDEEIHACQGWPGIRAAREAIAFADGPSESVLESRSRIALRDWGLPESQLQVRIGNQWGGFVARVDFFWEQFGVVGEADGAMKYDGSDPEPLHLEKKRQEIMEQDLDLLVVRWGNDDLRNFGSVVARLRRKFAKGARASRAPRQWAVLPPL